MNNSDPDLISLFATRSNFPKTDYSLAIRFAPILMFDKHEPFLPLAVGYSIIRNNTQSPSFARRIEVAEIGRSAPAYIIEYAIWWTWDIVHLYELEHIWLSLDVNEQIIGVEASWHGNVHDMMTSDGALPLKDGRVMLYSEPGKHAFSPVNEIPHDQIIRSRQLCGQMAGTGGLLVTPLFEQLRVLKSRRADQLIYTFLRKQAFEPSYDFDRSFMISANVLVPWLALKKWIPSHLSRVIDRLENNVSTV